jgi:magnesium transporter
MPVESYYLNADGKVVSGLSEKEIRTAFQSKEGLLWVNIAEIKDDDAKFLEETFQFHHLAVEDCISTSIHPPKIDDFGEYLFIIIHGINYAVASEIVETAELAIFLGQNFVVSCHSYPLYSVEAIKHRMEEDCLPMKRGADFLAHSLADALIDNVLPTVDRMTELAGEIEEETIRNPQKELLEAILKLKRSTLRIHGLMAPQREVFNSLSRGQFPIIRNDAQIFYRDVYDHVARIEDLNQTIGDRADSALATYLSSIANRQNETMKTLAVVATIFIPLTLVAGIYGMNFDNMPELHWEWGYYAVVGVMITVIALTIWRFSARGWINWGRRRVKKVINPYVNPERLIGYIKRNSRKHVQG